MDLSFIKNLPRDITITLIGGIGVGKSTSVFNFAKEEAQSMGYEDVFNGEYKPGKKYFIQFNERWYDLIKKHREDFYVFVNVKMDSIEPVDLTGFPRVIDNTIHYVPVSFADVLSTGDGLLFIDEITNVTREDQISALYSVLLDRRMGWTTLYPTVRIISAGNTIESTIATKLNENLVNRVMIIPFSITIDEWINYTGCKELGKFLKENQELFNEKPTPGEPFGTPRSWHRVCQLGYEYAKYLVSEGAYNTLVKWLETPDNSIHDVLDNPKLFSTLSIDKKMKVAQYLAKNFNCDVFLYIFDHEKEFVASILKNGDKKKIESCLDQKKIHL